MEKMVKDIRGEWRRRIAGLLILCVACSMSVPARAETAAATTLRMKKTEGQVNVSNYNGKIISLIEDMKLYNGYHVGTEEESYAWVSLDDTKLVKLDAVSEMEIRQKGKELELLVNSGNLFFNVTAPLKDDEILNIRTSSMVMGIRGTAGWVRVVDQWHTLVHVLEGTVTCSVTDPVSDQMKSEILHGGDLAEVVVYDKDKEGDKCDIFLRRYTEEEIRGYVMVELVEDDPIRDRIYQDSGLNISADRNAAQDRLKADEEEMREKLEDIKEQLKDQENHISVDPVWGNTGSTDSGTKGPGSGGGGGGSSGGGGGGSSSPSTPDPEPPTEPEDVVTLTMQVTDDQVDSYLSADEVNQVIVKAGPDLNYEQNKLIVDSGITVPAGKSLILESGVGMDVYNGQSVQVNGTLNTADNVDNSGTIQVTSSNTLQVAGTFVNQTSGRIENTSTGRIVSDNGIDNYGKIENSGQIEGGIICETGAVFSMDSGTLEAGSGEAAMTVYSGSEIINCTGGKIAGTEGGYAIILAGDTGWERYEPGDLLSRLTDLDIYADEEKILGRKSGSDVSAFVLPNGFGREERDDSYWHLIQTQKITYNYYFEGNGGTWEGADVSILTADHWIEFPEEPVREGYLFDGWYWDPVSEEGGPVEEYTLAESGDVLYAHWKVATRSYVPVKRNSKSETVASPSGATLSDAFRQESEAIQDEDLLEEEEDMELEYDLILMALPAETAERMKKIAADYLF